MNEINLPKILLESSPDTLWVYGQVKARSVSGGLTANARAFSAEIGLSYQRLRTALDCLCVMRLIALSMTRGEIAVTLCAADIPADDTVALTIPCNVVRQQTKRFVRPTLEEIADYVNEQGFNVNIRDFYDYYESNGWRVGKSPMKDWKATIRRWNRNNYGTRQIGTAAAQSRYSGIKQTATAILQHSSNLDSLLNDCG